MKLSAFEKIIRKVVREEIDHALRREIALLKEELVSQPQQRVVETKNNTQEAEDFRAKLRSQMPPPNFNTGNDTLNSLLSETGIAPTLALGSETASGSALINQVGYDNFRISLADLSANITGTATVNTVSGITGTGATGTIKLWSLIDTTSGGDETWTRGVAN